MPPEETLGSRLRRLRLAAGLTQKDLADPSYTAAYVSTIESDRRHPSDTALDFFAQKLGVAVDELRTGHSPHLWVELGLRVQKALKQIYDGDATPTIAELRSVIDTATRFDLTAIEANAEEVLGIALRRTNRPEEALGHLRRAAALRHPDPALVNARATVEEARCLWMLGDLRHAVHILESFRRMLDYDDVQDPLAVLLVNSALVPAYLAAGLTKQAAESADKALAVAPGVDRPDEVANMSINVAQLMLDKGRYESALKHLHRAEDLYLSVDWPAEVGRARLARGIVRREMGELEGAEEELAAVVRGEVGTLDRVRALTELAIVRRLTHSRESPLELLEEAKSLLEEGDRAELALIVREQGLNHALDDREAAVEHLQRSADIFEATQMHTEAGRSLRSLGEVLEASGDLVASCEAYRRSIELLDKARREDRYHFGASLSP